MKTMFKEDREEQDEEAAGDDDAPDHVTGLSGAIQTTIGAGGIASGGRGEGNAVAPCVTGFL